MKKSTAFLAFSLTFAIAASGLSAQSAQSPSTEPEARTGRAFERYEMLNERVKENAGEIDILFVGDSITQGWEKAGREVWDEFYGHRKAVNIGIGGDWTQSVLWRLENGNIDGIFPKVAVLMIGTNNSGLDRHSAAQIRDGIEAIVVSLQEKLPETKILLLGIFPRGKEFNDQRGKILQVNQTLHHLADNDRVHYLDIGHIFLEPNGSISEEIMPDALHLTPAGYRLWAEEIEAPIAALLNESVSFAQIDRPSHFGPPNR